jgi:hypothetical protein
MKPTILLAVLKVGFKQFDLFGIIMIAVATIALLLLPMPLGEAGKITHLT